MKAVIMAGGEGTRLRPVSSGLPKPMVRLLERPLLEHIIILLKKAGITDICTTLGYMPEAVTNYFGDGSRFGVRLRHFIEREPLGTAGGVLACRDFYGDEDFLVISGDAACDFDLTPLADFHRRHKPAVTMGLYSHPEPLQYGLVLTDGEGHVRSFIEKPPWERVITDCVNTGIYIIGARAMSYVPENTPFDFAKDLFPLLMISGESIMASTMSGYWCDVGNPSAYLRCGMDALGGKLKVTPGVPMIHEGVYSGTKLPDDVEIRPPSVIGENVRIEHGAIIGPLAVIGSGSVIGRGAVIRMSVVDGAIVGEGAEVSNAVICGGCTVHENATVEPGEVIAPEGAKQPPPVKAAKHDIRRIPAAYSDEVPCKSRAGLMRIASEYMAEFGADFTDGLRLQSDKGSIRISPCPTRESIIVEADAERTEAAAELCAEYVELLTGMSEKQS